MVFTIVVVTLIFVVGLVVGRDETKEVPAKDDPTPKDAVGYAPAIASPTDATPSEIVWLHIPKCGTSFLNTLYHYACPGIPPFASVGTETDPEHQEFDLTLKYPMNES